MTVPPPSKIVPDDLVVEGVAHDIPVSGVPVVIAPHIDTHPFVLQAIGTALRFRSERYAIHKLPEWPSPVYPVLSVKVTMSRAPAKSSLPLAFYIRPKTPPLIPLAEKSYWRFNLLPIK